MLYALLFSKDQQILDSEDYQAPLVTSLVCSKVPDAGKTQNYKVKKNEEST